MTGVKSLLIDFMEKGDMMVVFGQNSEGVVMGNGTFECRVFKLKNVLYVKDLKGNPISIGPIYDAIYSVLFHCNEGKFFLL